MEWDKCAHNIHHSTPAAKSIAIDPGENALRQRLEEVLRLKVLPVHGLAHAKQGLARGTRHHKVARRRHGTQKIHPRDERRAVRLQASNHRLAEERPKPLLVQHRGHEVRERRRLHVPLLPQLVQVVPELELLAQRLHVGSQPREPEVEVVVHLEHLLVVRRQSLVLNPEAQVARDADAILAGHGNDRASVVRHDRHDADCDAKRGGAVDASCLTWFRRCCESLNSDL
mmetsp:Transcript_32622/g.103963  ORF Transcript_32622/g.103963 Transcript_32622/m.103963 type:complete len:228 (-) Transcript_32622:54-737(-)